jgi:putative ABC transport system ATP-binding protein
VLAQVGLAHRRNAYPRQLSGGETARAGLAVALANTPAILLADEPTGELDGETEAGLLELLRRRAQDGAGVLLVSHSPEVADLADRVVHLHDGRIQQ